MGHNGKSSALADAVSDWEKWTITQEDDGEFVLKGHHGTYLMGRDNKSTELADDGVCIHLLCHSYSPHFVPVQTGFNIR